MAPLPPAFLAALPPEQQQQILAFVADREEAVREEERSAGAAREQAAREEERSAFEAERQAEEILLDLRRDPAITALLQHNTQNKSTKHTVKKDLAAALEAVDKVDPGESGTLSYFRDKLHAVKSKLDGQGDGGYCSNSLKIEVKNALEVLGVKLPAQSSDIVPWNDDGLSDDDEEEEAGPDVDSQDVEPEPEPRPQPRPADDDPEVVKDAFNLIMSSQTLRRSIRFDLAPFLRRVHQNVKQAQAAAARSGDGLLSIDETLKMFGGGRTQARKTPLKAAQFILCRMMGVPTILLTTNVAGREDLFKKFGELLAEIDVPVQPQPVAFAGTQYEYRKVSGVQKLVAVGRASPSDDERGTKPGLLSVDTIAQQHRGWAVSQLQQGACIVSNNTAAAIEKVGGLVREARGDRARSPLQFVLTIDEADDFYRTDGDSYAPIKLEQALTRLKELGPLVCFEVSATLLAVYMALHREGGAEAVAGADLWYVEPCDDYVGAEMLMPPQNVRGEYQFLNESDLTKSNTLADSKVRAVYADAAGDATTPTRSLLLDATTPAVTAANSVGIFDKARLVERLHPHAVVVVVSGSLIKWWTVMRRADRPGDYNGTVLRGKDRVVGRVIAKIDKYYPDRPIFVFGYSQMVRGVSYRSNLRVPSHFVLLYKSGMPLCRLVQAAGRAMGEQARLLRANGFNHVVMLTQNKDFDAICAYPEFLKAIKRQMEEGGASLADALGGTRYDAKYNCFSASKMLGAKRLTLDSFVQQTLQFEPATEPIGLGNAELDRELSTGFGLRRAVLEVLLDSTTLDDEYAMGSKDVHEELETGNFNRYFGDASTTVTRDAVTKVLKELCVKPAHREPVLESNGRSGKYLKFFINEEGLDALPGRNAAVPPPVPVQVVPRPAQPLLTFAGDMETEAPLAYAAQLAEDAAAAHVQPRREATNERMTRREREMQAAQEAGSQGDDVHEAAAAEVAAGASSSAADAAGAMTPPPRPRRNAALAATHGIASCSAQLALHECCDERPEDLLEGRRGKRPCHRGSSPEVSAYASTTRQAAQEAGSQGEDVHEVLQAPEAAAEVAACASSSAAHAAARPRRNAALAATHGIASSSEQLALHERCDERPEDLLEGPRG